MKELVRPLLLLAPFILLIGDWIGVAIAHDESSAGCMELRATEDKLVCSFCGQLESNGMGCQVTQLNSRLIKGAGKEGHACTWTILHQRLREKTRNNRWEWEKGLIISKNVQWIPEHKLGTCEKFKDRYVCYCADAQNCNQEPPPCTWIRKADPENRKPVGCREDDEDVIKSCDDGHGNCEPDMEKTLMCSYCSQHQSNETGLGCQVTSLLNEKEQCMGSPDEGWACAWAVVNKLNHKEPTEEGFWSWKRGDTYFKRCMKRGNPGTCEKIRGIYICYCNCDFCNKQPPPCSWIRKADPNNVDPYGCIDYDVALSEDATCPPVDPDFLAEPLKRPEAMDDLVGCMVESSNADELVCSYCGTLESHATGCQVIELNNRVIKSPSRKGYACTWTVLHTKVEEQMESERFVWEKGLIVSKSVQKVNPEKLGTCQKFDEFYVCYCGDSHICNLEPPPCSWIREIDPDNEDPVGCFDFGVVDNAEKQCMK